MGRHANLTRVTANRISEATTIDRPDGVSNVADEYSPAITGNTPAAVAKTAILSGLVEKRRAVAAGITSKATISSIPTILMETAITAETRTADASVPAAFRRLRQGRC